MANYESQGGEASGIYDFALAGTPLAGEGNVDVDHSQTLPGPQLASVFSDDGTAQLAAIQGPALVAHARTPRSAASSPTDARRSTSRCNGARASD